MTNESTVFLQIVHVNMRSVPPQISMAFVLFSTKHCPSFVSSFAGASRSVSFHGRASLRPVPRSLSPSSTHSVGDIPPDPKSLLSNLEEDVSRLKKWFEGKNNILCLTGAGISTDSGIPDYRGHNGSYHKGHQPMVHNQFMKLHKMRQRYWGRSMIGWREFAMAPPNEGHYAISKLEKLGKVGVTFEDNVEYYKTDCENAELEWAFSAGYQKMSIITQNVDGLHRKAGSNSKYITELHGTHDRLVCMTCGGDRCRHDFHNELDEQNSAWIQGQLSEMNSMNSEDRSQQLRPDGDAFVQREDYDDIEIPPCSECDDVNDNDNGDGSAPVPGFYKPDVVFFGDSVPKHRVNKCYGAVDAADGLLCIGSSLAVHSAYRFVQRAAANKIPIAILNVGETRAEVNNLDVLKIEAPAGPTLGRLVEAFESEQKKRVRVD